MDWDQKFIRMAKEVSTWSKDPSRKIGAIAVGNKRQILSTGYNGFPRGILDSPERYNDKPTKYKLVCHAEMNCVYNATYNGVSLDGADLYVWGLPVCSECCKGIIQVGIKRVFWSTDQEIPQNWRESMATSNTIFQEVGVINSYIDLNLF